MSEVLLYASHLARQMIETTDQFFAARWWWRLRQRRSEDRLDAALEKHGEGSFEARRAANDVSEMDFAVGYWRAASPAVRKHVLLAAEQGASIDDLRIMVVNRDLRWTGDRLTVRRSAMLGWLGWASVCVVVLHGLLMMGLIIGLNASWSAKMLAALVVVTVYLLFYRGWSLYLSRAAAAVRRSGDRLESLSMSVESAIPSIRRGIIS